MKKFSLLSVLPACACILCLLLLCAEDAHAGYLDPGSGSTLVQAIIAVIAACKRVWSGFCSGLACLFGRKS